jgi:hypothetical protein
MKVNVKMDLKEIGLEGVDWPYLDLDVNQRLSMSTRQRLSGSEKGGEFWTSWRNINISRRTVCHGVIYLVSWLVRYIVTLLLLLLLLLYAVL